MDKVYVDIDVIRGILSAYHRAGKMQSRVYGLILGSKKNNIYHITDVIYGFIFEEENPKTNKKELIKINDESLASLFNSLKQKFKMNNPNVPQNKTNKEKETKFQSNDTLTILGGFATDKQPFSELFRFYTTLDKVNDDIFPNLNKLLLLVDPSYKDQKDVKYGIKAYEWEIKNIRIKNLEKSNNFIFFKELESEVVQQLNNIGVLGHIKNQNLWDKIFNLKIDKNEKKNINELLLDLKDDKSDIITRESNAEFIKNKVKESIEYLNLFQKLMESEDGKSKDILSDDDYNTIAYIISQLDPILYDKEIMDGIKNDINQKYNIDSLSQLIEVQLALTDKIKELVN